MCDAQGNVIGLFGIARDITERRRQNEELRASRATLAAALASMTDAVFISDVAGTFVEFNDAFAVFHRFRNKSECSRRLRDYPELLEVFLANGQLAPLDLWAVPRALRGESGSNVEYTLRRTDTGETWVGSYSFGPIRGNDGAIVGSVVVARDVTERKRAETRLKEQVEELRRWHAATLGREMRVLELKREVNRLLVEADRPPRYPSVIAAGSTAQTTGDGAAPDLPR